MQGVEPKTRVQMQSVTFGNSVALNVTPLSFCPLAHDLTGWL